MKVISLFSGAGGLDWGFNKPPYRIIFANDVNSMATCTYAKNFGLRHVGCVASEGVVANCDVAQLDFKELDADIIAGGPPCQDFSIVRGPDRRGIEVRRGKLYMHFVRALTTIEPSAFVFENVPGLLTSNDGLAFKAILSDFRKSGYEIPFVGIVDFSALGVPQRRKRLIIIGVRKDLLKGIGDFWTAKALAERALRGSVFRTYPVASMEVLEGGRIDDLQDVYFSIMKEWEGVWSDVGTQQALEWKQKVWDKLTFDVVEDYLAANGADAVGIEEALKQHEDVLRFLGYDRPAHELKLSDGTTELPRVSQAVSDKLRRIPPGENYKFLEGTPWAMKGHDISLIYRRLHPLRPSYTVVAYGGGGTYGYHYRRSRTQLSLRELARLQSFPDDFLFCGSKHEIRAQIGEAVPPLASFVLAKIVHDILHLT